ncbi:TetR/AcrR family transcriptional regulator [Clostridium sp. 'deep sea']|uniref:TetR/AcrR family transcriptional regulator n=1 Tax=Clostridium sp. 'deep sea' TaxID=2779445 RepID=UPI0018968ECA|nr:TetR/AcrR family transcriptional regulator [Clostridium sp. 'deep sea']QOR35137.1 TetR/AcrR family transcriptional regulator [Clostridium sp. 'deep sea']
MKTNQSNTKRRIIESAISLFYEKGYEHVTIREIAKAVGIRGSSIYNHFNSKENILEEILNSHKQRLAATYNNEKIKTRVNQLLKGRDLNVILTELLKIALLGLQDPLLLKVLKILSVEQLKINMVREYFYNYYLLKARAVFKEIFDIMLNNNVITYTDTEFLAHEFHSFIIYKFYEHYMLLQNYSINNTAITTNFKKHISFFVNSIT